MLIIYVLVHTGIALKNCAYHMIEPILAIFKPRAKL